MEPPKVVVDTNVLVAASFRPASASGRLLKEICCGRVVLVWNAATRREAEYVVHRIPPLSWECIAECFREEGCFRHDTDPEAYDFIPDPHDRKFAALANASGVPLITSDDHLLRVRERLSVPVLPPSDWLREV